jgi:hypothetical protein
MSIVPSYIPPSFPIPQRTRRRRPLNCGYVPRARRHTGIIVSSTTSLDHFDTVQGPPVCWTLYSPLNRRCLTLVYYHLVHYVFMSPSPLPRSSRCERLITVPFTTIPSHITSCLILLHDFSADKRVETTVVTLGIACLHEYMTRCTSPSAPGACGL